MNHEVSLVLKLGGGVGVVICFCLAFLQIFYMTLEKLDEADSALSCSLQIDED